MIVKLKSYELKQINPMSNKDIVFSHTVISVFSKKEMTTIIRVPSHCDLKKLTDRWNEFIKKESLSIIFKKDLKEKK